MRMIRYIGLDVHKDTISVAVAEAGRDPARLFADIPNEFERLRKTLKKLEGCKDEARLVICYEAGPTGYGLYRQLHDAGYECSVVAPSLVPTRSGDRVKTDRRDAVRLAHFLRSGDLTEVYVPDEADEALRDLERAREDAKKAELTAKHHLGKFLLRHGRRWHKQSNWTLEHLDWIRGQKFSHEAQRCVLIDYLKAVEDARERVKRLEEQIESLIHTSVLAPLITALQAFRGIAMVSAVTVAVEVGDLRRFDTAAQFMSYVGLTPSEHSSGQRRKQGSITRAGNGHVRRILVEAAWHYRYLPSMSKRIRRRNQPVAEGVRQIAWKAQKRLHQRMVRLIARGKNKNMVVTAIARELAGFIWAVGQEEELLAT